MSMMFRLWLRRIPLFLPALLLGPLVAQAVPVAGRLDLLELHPATNDNHLVLKSTFMLGSGLNSFTQSAGVAVEVASWLSANITSASRSTAT